jgi:hypothetical protein
MGSGGRRGGGDDANLFSFSKVSKAFFLSPSIDFRWTGSLFTAVYVMRKRKVVFTRFRLTV